MGRRPAASLMLAALSLVPVSGLASEVDVRGLNAPLSAVAGALASENFAQTPVGARVTLRGLPVGERRLDLELERFEVWTPDGVFEIDDQPAARPDVVLLRGKVAGEEGSLVVLGLGRDATNGFIQTGGTTFVVSTGQRGGMPATPEDIRIADIREFRFEDGLPFCGITADNMPAFSPLGIPVVPHEVEPFAERGDAPCRLVRVAVDTDWEWCLETFGGNAQAGGEYLVFLLAAISEIYQRDVNTRLAIPYLRVFSSNVDPYNGGVEPDPLSQVRAHWRAEKGHIGRETVHLFTGANTDYGGVAYLSVLCSTDSGYGVSSYSNGSFPYPLQENSGGNWDLIVTAHELGHNFGTGHTHDSYNPPIDRCGLDCTGNLNSTIMSYCHICPGGLNNIDLRFHPLVQQVMLNFLDTVPCDVTPAPAPADDTAQTVVGVPTEIFVLGNDAGAGCAPLGLASVQSPTPAGAAVSIVQSPNPTGNPTGARLLYTPAPGFSGVDSFTYTTTGGQSAGVAVEVLAPRAAVAITNERSGLLATYHDIPPSSIVPVLELFPTVLETTVSQLNYPSTSGNAVGGPLADEVGAVFKGYLRVPADGLYTLELESDDGSRLFIGNTQVVNNNGLHGMVRVAGQIALAAGDHPLRIDYFENQGSAGLIFRWSGPGVSGVVPASALRHAAQDCGVADFATPYGVLDLADISLFILGFQIQYPDADLAPPFGVFDLADLNAFIDAFAAGCAE